MRIQVVSDLHLEFHNVLPAVELQEFHNVLPAVAEGADVLVALFADRQARREGRRAPMTLGADLRSVFS